MDVKTDPKSELTIMNTLFYKFLSESGRNCFAGAVVGTVLGIVLKRPKIGLFGGIGLAFGLTMSKYERAFAEVRLTKQFPQMEESYGVSYLTEKTKIGKSKLFTKLREYNPFNKKAQ